MQDKEIRKILIEKLKIENENFRIFQEKSIGSSICDLMLVTPDGITGFEIKSDSDNFERLSKQIEAYDMFFDKNYIVVGERYKERVLEKIPDHWGIYEVTSTTIFKKREAKDNRRVRREKQLSILWKLELKNILTKNALPLYSLEDKEYIIDEITKQVPGGILRKQVAEEILNRDYSRYDAVDYSIRGEDEVNQPLGIEGLASGELIDRLSEEDLSTFTLDRWMNIYQNAVKQRKQKEEELRTKEQEELKNEGNPIVPYTEIEARLGAPWISEKIVNVFANEVLKAPQDLKWVYDNQQNRWKQELVNKTVKFEPITGTWFVEKCKNIVKKELTYMYGTYKMNALYILEATLNSRPIKVFNGNDYNEMETLAAIEKQKAMQQAFKDWIWREEWRRNAVEMSYSRMFGSYVKKDYDGSSLEFEGMNPKIFLFDYQKDAVQKIISTKNTLLSFDVGSGKTYIMIAAAMEMRRSGLSRRNLFVVPNNIVGQWEKMFCELYPSAKILTVDPKSFTKDKRGKVLRQIKEGDYDGVIMAYSCFEMLHLSSDTLLIEMNNAIKRLHERYASVHSSVSSHYVGKISGCINREANRIKSTFAELEKCSLREGIDIFFDELDINTIFVDEAHNFKNIPIKTSMRNLRGINTKGSVKCLNMLKKVQYVQSQNGGRGAVFATGTPLSNSISDTYAMQCYLQYDELERTGLQNFDSWVKTFAELEEICEIDVDTSGFRVVERFSKFFNLTELSKMFSQVSIFYNVDKEGLPTLTGYTDVVIEKSCDLDDYMYELYERTEQIRSGAVDRREDNMLKVSTDGRKAALSLNLVDIEELYDKHCKLYNCVNTVYRVYKDNPGSAQLIFCDLSIPKKGEYSVYEDLRVFLIDKGIPKNEIAFIHSCKSEEDKVKLYKKVNLGEVRVLIGSTFKLGIGANVQERLKAIHHLDVPWRPADMVQREGRILRRGNTNDEVEIYRYIVKGSFDSYSWQILQNKQRFISQFLSGANTVRTIVDFDNDELNYAQVKALALDEPIMKEYVEKENELRNAKTVYRQELVQRGVINEEIEALEGKIAIAKREHSLAKENLEYINDHLEEITEGYIELLPIITEGTQCYEPNRLIGNAAEFEVIAPLKQSEDKKHLIFKRLNGEYMVELGDSLQGNKIRLANFFERFENIVKNRARAISEYRIRRDDLKAQLGYSSNILERIKKLERELEKLFSKISLK